MRFFPPPLEIGDREGFTKEKDIFGREAFGRKLTNLLGSVSDPLVVAVDGQWGSGKTTFLKMWAGSLRNEGFPVVYFDAFESDYIDDAFTAIAGEIIALAQAKHKEHAPAAQQFLEKAVRASKVLLRSGLKVGVKLATVGALEAADLESVASDVGSEVAEVSDRYIGRALTERREQENAIREFREALTALPTLLSDKGAENADAEQKKPLVFIIDELDRCRPVFALEMLERIKHFFSVPDVHFVLGTHLQQLNNSVVVAYGPNIESQTYLQKFIHITFQLIDRADHEHERTAKKFVDYLVRVLEFRSEDHELVRYTTEFIRDYAHDHGLSLRMIERIMTTLAMTAAFTSSKWFRPPPIVAGLCILKVIAPVLFAKAKRGALTLADVKDVFQISTGNFFSDWWVYCLDPSPDEEILKRLHSVMFKYSFGSRESLIPFVANDIVDRLEPVPS